MTDVEIARLIPALVPRTRRSASLLRRGALL